MTTKKYVLNGSLIAVLLLGLFLTYSSGVFASLHSQAFFGNSEELSSWTLNYGGSFTDVPTLDMPSNTDGPYLHLVATEYDSGGWIAVMYFFDASELTVGQSYTMNYWFKGTAMSNAQFISFDSYGGYVDQYYASSYEAYDWTEATLDIPPIQAADSYCLAFTVYSAGEWSFDAVNFEAVGSVVTPSPTPAVPTPSPSPSPSPYPGTVTLYVKAPPAGNTIMVVTGLTTYYTAPFRLTMHVGDTILLNATSPSGTFVHWVINNVDVQANPNDMYTSWSLTGDTTVSGVFLDSGTYDFAEAASGFALIIGGCLGVGYVNQAEAKRKNAKKP